MLSVCGHTYCLDCVSRIAASRQGRVTCPECRKVEAVNPPFTPESLSRQLVANAVAIPKKNDSARCKANDVREGLIPERAEVEERVPTADIETLHARVFSQKSFCLGRCLMHVAVWVPIVLSVVAQVASVISAN